MPDMNAYEQDPNDSMGRKIASAAMGILSKSLGGMGGLGQLAGMGVGMGAKKIRRKRRVEEGLDPTASAMSMLQSPQMQAAGGMGGPSMPPGMGTPQIGPNPQAAQGGIPPQILQQLMQQQQGQMPQGPPPPQMGQPAQSMDDMSGQMG